MDFKKHIETAWRLTIRFIAPLIIMTLLLSVVGFLTLGILGPVTLAGYFQSILLMVREGREPKVQDLFSEMRLFFPLLAFGIVVVLAIFVGFLMLVLPGFLIALGVGYFCLYMLPLMTDERMSLMDAVRGSFQLTTQGQLVDQVAVFILFVGISAVGGSVFIAWLFTQPLATVFLMSVYEDRKRAITGNVHPPMSQGKAQPQEEMQ